ncbi:carbohydrate ABC transporter permease [Treponema phagedenis]|uniref:carbohydrate ABC transporter permease n=1 Tax=Treponema phagedenis TaxID=162 RepID=UPI0001F64339|nr:sugar ABC transporter permease [Treponema phagedenis]EFW38765.1 ABC transporter, permease protein [Treponema phagedenis F0421]TYT78705.1 sugar ABC transporter permease [Treponema phagedenis]
MKKSFRSIITPYLFLFPFLFFFILFFAYPVIYSIAISFMRYTSGSFQWVGIKNFSFLFSDELFYKSLKNTFTILFLQVPLQTIFALIFAVCINNAFLKAKGLFRLFIFLPILIDTVSYSIVFGLLFNADSGFVNAILNTFGFPSLQWFNTGYLARLLIVLAVTWRWTGYNVIIILSGLQNINTELYEAAAIDGANSIRRFFAVTVPGVKQVLIFSIILSISGVLQLFTEPYLLTGGGPVNESLTVVQYLYNLAFVKYNFGVSSAGSYILAIIIGLVTVIQLKLTKDS